MKAIALLFLICLSSSTWAHDGGETRICSSPATGDCVTSNWGQVEPDGLEGAIAPREQGSPAAMTNATPRMAVRMVPVASASARGASLKAVVSPVNLFPRETQTLVGAIKRARFDADGSIASGGDAITKAAAAALRRAGNKYALTIYIKVPERIKDDDAATLNRKVASINELLVRSDGRDPGKY